jgi:HD domain
MKSEFWMSILETCGACAGLNARHPNEARAPAFQIVDSHVSMMSKMAIPSISEAHRLLEAGRARNPGPWAEHSIVAAESARAIAAHHPDLEPDRAYVLALLHDIGRGSGGPGIPDVRHILDGYHSMLEHGYDDSARICLTHSFPIKESDAFASHWAGLVEEKQFVQEYLDRVEYTAYDRLVQLCDAISLSSGPCLMEMRLVDVVRRHGFNSLTLAKWQALFALQQEFGEAIGASIYTVLPGIVDNTFGFTPGAHVA